MSNSDNDNDAPDDEIPDAADGDVPGQIQEPHRGGDTPAAADHPTPTSGT